MTYQEEENMMHWMENHRKRCPWGRSIHELFDIATVTDIDEEHEKYKITCKCTASKEFITHKLYIVN